MIKAQQIINLLNETSNFDFDDYILNDFIGLDEEYLRAAETVSYELYDKLITHIFSESYTDIGLRIIIQEDYLSHFQSQTTSPSNSPETGASSRQPSRRPDKEPIILGQGDKAEAPDETGGEISKSNTRLGSLINDIFLELGVVLRYLWQELKVSWSQLVVAFKTREIYQLLKFFAFSLRSIAKSVGKLIWAVKHGLFRAFKELYETNFVRDLERGLIVVDRVISEKPILKILTGPTMCGFLVWVKLTHMISEQKKYDDKVTIEKIARSLGGQYSIRDLLASPSALLTDVLTLIGIGSTISITWLSSGVYPIAVILLIIGLKYLGKDPPTSLTSKVKYRSASG